MTDLERMIDLITAELHQSKRSAFHLKGEDYEGYHHYQGVIQALEWALDQAHRLNQTEVSQ